MNPDKNYLAGYCAGDGLLHSDKRRGYEVKLVDSNKDFIIMLTELIERLYGVKPSITKQGNAYIVRIFRKEVYEDLHKTIKQCLDNPDRHFVGGLFDADGDYTASKRRLRLTNKDSRIIETVRRYLELNGVKPNIYLRTKGKYHWYTLELYGLRAVKIASILDLRHPKFSSLKSSRIS